MQNTTDIASTTSTIGVPIRITSRLSSLVSSTSNTVADRKAVVENDDTVVVVTGPYTVKLKRAILKLTYTFSYIKRFYLMVMVDCIQASGATNNNAIVLYGQFSERRGSRFHV